MSGLSYVILFGLILLEFISTHVPQTPVNAKRSSLQLYCTDAFSRSQSCTSVWDMLASVDYFLGIKDG